MENNSQSNIPKQTSHLRTDQITTFLSQDYPDLREVPFTIHPFYLENEEMREILKPLMDNQSLETLLESIRKDK